jgi:outer membrane receptor for ferrienterochelin and colicin
MIKNILFCFFCAFSLQALSQNISGYVLDSESGEPLIGATVYKNNSEGTTTNKYGYFSISTGNTDSVFVSYVGYQNYVFACQACSDSVLYIKMESHNELDEVTVTSQNIQNELRSPSMGLNRMTARQIEQMPMVLGESDVLKSVQMLPGVNNGSEGMAGISVRGGSPDQTLILLDDVPVYNVNHMFGYFSVFNSDAISSVNLVKGAIPSRYGGRLTSVLDLTSRDGNYRKLKSSLSMGTMALKATVEGPIIKEKASFMLSLRKTWPDIPLRAYYYFAESDYTTTYGFYDVNAKVNYRVSDKDRLFLSFYKGDDAFKDKVDEGYEEYKYDNTFSWGNNTASLRWNHVFTNKLFANFTSYYSLYQYKKRNYMESTGSSSEQQKSLEEHSSSLTDIALKSDFDYMPGGINNVKFGAKLSRKSFLPVEESYENNESARRILSDVSGNITSADIYIEDEISIAHNLKANVGLRASVLFSDFNKNVYWQPRASLAWTFARNMSFKAGYSRMAQFVHQLTNSGLSMPNDLWVTSNNVINPSYSDLYSVGVYYNHNDLFQVSAEAYYSKLSNVICYYPGTDFTQLDAGRNWYDIVLQGKGEAYGAEFMLEKNKGRFTGFVNYTWSRSLRSYPELYDGAVFPYDYDIPHKISASVNYNFKYNGEAKFKKSFSANFNFSSGRLLSVATAKFPSIFHPSINDENNWFSGDVYYTPQVNNYRMDNFHRLDIAFNLKATGDIKSSWTFGIYNVYNKFNATHFGFRNDKMYEVAMFPIMPIITWKYKLK